MKKCKRIKNSTNFNVLFPEERDKIEGTIEQAHAVLLRMLKIFDFICQKHEIKYWLDYGTLLGAVRHHNFIPWDGDIDIGIFRKDFELFKQIALKELPYDMFFQTVETDPYYHPIFIEAKLRDKFSSYTSFAKDYPECKWHNGLQIDIFIYDLDKKSNMKFLNRLEKTTNRGRIFLHKEEIEHLISSQFADLTLPIPSGYDSYLKRVYGNYLTLPPKKERIATEGITNVFKSCNHDMALEWEKKK